MLELICDLGGTPRKPSLFDPGEAPGVGDGKVDIRRFLPQECLGLEVPPSIYIRLVNYELRIPKQDNTHSKKKSPL